MDPTLPRPVTPDEVAADRQARRYADAIAPRRLIPDVLLGAIIGPLAIGAIGLAWIALEAGLPYTAAASVVVLLVGGTWAWRAP